MHNAATARHYACGAAITKHQREAAKQTEGMSAEEKKLANGKSTGFEVLRLQRDVTQARLDETRALADYNKSVEVLAANTGTRR